MRFMCISFANPCPGQRDTKQVRLIILGRNCEVCALPHPHTPSWMESDHKDTAVTGAAVAEPPDRSRLESSFTGRSGFAHANGF